MTLPPEIHTAVLADELVSMLGVGDGDTVVDCTVGAGGHTEKILDAVGPTGRVIGFDRDEEILARSRQKLERFIRTNNLLLFNERFSKIATITGQLKLTHQVRAICADLGVSSLQLDQPERGFSFRFEGPLDMRMGQAGELKASTVVNEWDESELTQIFFQFGEEPQARRISQGIVKRRAKKLFATTTDLAEFVAETKKPTGRPAKRIHPATQIFQALRIVVNDELDELRSLLNDGFALLGKSGRLGIISFHSLEDRLVKQKFVELSRGGGPEDKLPLTETQRLQRGLIKAKLIKPFPQKGSVREISINPRARSARLRAIEKL